MNIDSILKPYEDSQPQNLCMNSFAIERIPHIVDPATGQVTQEFQQFYNQIVDAVTSNNWNELYSISDKMITEDEFCSYLHNAVSPIWDKFYAADKSAKGIDIELNLSRFQNTHRNLIGSFYVLIYTLERFDPMISEAVSTELHQYQTEILFTYKFSKFTVVSNFREFQEVE